MKPKLNKEENNKEENNSEEKEIKRVKLIINVYDDYIEKRVIEEPPFKIKKEKS